MIPIHLKLSGFLSYRDSAEVDFRSFDLACISGPNGAGKSSLLDAITWALFGQARKRDDSLINTHPDVKSAEVAFTFQYEDNLYRVIRTLPRGRTTQLEFQIQQTARNDQPAEWRPLSERTLRETQARIEAVLRLDYETFVNAAFFLQGKADQFTQQSPGRRKDILGNILGLEAWEVYRERTAGRRKAIERDLDGIDGRLGEIEAELAEEPQRKSHLEALEQQLAGLRDSRKAQEAALASVKQVHAVLEAQRELVRKLTDGLDRSNAGLAGLRQRLAGREAERDSYADLQAHAAEVEAAYQGWQAARAELERWEATAGQFREHEQERLPLLAEIAVERARLEEEGRRLRSDAEAVSSQQAAVNGLLAELETARASLAEAEVTLARRLDLEVQLQAGRDRQTELRLENERLKTEMDTVKTRLDRLKEANGAVCPLCGQTLSPEHRQSTITQIEAEGKEMGDRWRANKSAVEMLVGKLKELEAQSGALSDAENVRLAQSAVVSQLTERLEALQRLEKEWQTVGAKRLAGIEKLLEKEKYAAEARKQLAKVDKELAAIGYNIAAHEAARQSEREARSAEEQFRRLESARAALKPLEDEIANLQSQIRDLKVEIDRQQAEHAEAAASLAAADLAAPELESSERALFDLQEQENRLDQEVGAARQKVSVLDDLRSRRTRLETDRQELALAVGRHKSLERAFGRDGVPALLIEQALPEIEARANELLDRLSDGTMSVRFVTQAEYRDRKRDDLRETLDIQISDGAGARDYEMFSGGEAFRVNFAIRLALARVLAGRKGARLQTLVIDEGFGSQDTQGRQRLIEAINAVRSDFAKILVITHMDELKDAFPNRIEVEKGGGNSTVRVM
ncbi:MAG: SMC family ATPase [Anaerolineales bacterium]|nr:SMC family ATPase [Anaerolineales bacterium]